MVETTGMQNECCVLREEVTWRSGDVMEGYMEDTTAESRDQRPPQNDKNLQSRRKGTHYVRTEGKPEK